MSSNNNDMSEIKILIVEDESEVRFMIKDMLKDIGLYQVYEASSGEDALSFINTAPDMVDMIICDWNMPSMSGLELLKRVRAVDEGFPFLMVTGRMDKTSVVDAKESGVSAYIAKPFTPEQLEAKIRIVVHRMRLRASR